MEFTDEAIGTNLIEIITSGLYDGNQNCLREYIQNSIDSRAKNIDVFFENGSESLIIKDDGSGMSKKELKEAWYMGISSKKEEDTGWRGIGIWSGVPACNRIVIITKKMNDKKYRIEIDNKKILDGNVDKQSLLDFLTSATGDIEEIDLGADESFEYDHFTMVRLESILKTQKDVFGEKVIHDYLIEAVPAPFDKDRFSFAPEIEGWLREKGVKLPDVNINFCHKPIFKPPCKDDIFFKKVIKHEFKVGDQLVAVGWFITSIENEQLEKPNKGIYFKKKGYTIGNENLVRNLYDKTYHQWQYGEIHVISEEVRENAARNNFEYNSGVVGPFLEEVGDFIGKLQSVNRYTSNRALGKQIGSVQKHLSNGDVRSAKKTLAKARTKATKNVKFPDDPVIQEMKSLIDTKFENEKTQILKLEEKTKTGQGNEVLLKKRKEQLNNIIDSLPPEVRKKCKRTTVEGKLYPELSVTDSIKDILEDKTGLKSTKGEIFNLSQAAYGWENVTSKKDPPILYIDKNKPVRNHRLGVMIYTIHDLFVNLPKHEKDEESFKWFKNATEEDKYAMATGMYAIIGLIYRLIEKSEEYQP